MDSVVQALTLRIPRLSFVERIVVTALATAEPALAETLQGQVPGGAPIATSNAGALPAIGPIRRISTRTP